MTDSMIRVLLVDDHAVIRAGFRMILEAQPDLEVVGEAADGEMAISQARLLHPDVICMDVQMPKLDGLAATALITADPEINTAVMVVTTFDDDDYLFAALEAGASGFLLKNAGPEDLVNAVRVAASGDALLAPEVTHRVIARAKQNQLDDISNDEPDAASAALIESLTAREYEVLLLLAQAMSNAEIAAALFLGESTVKTHVSNILFKLQLRDRVAAVVFAHQNSMLS